MGPFDVRRYKSWYDSNPSAFVEGALGFCKQAAFGDTAWETVKPLLLAMALGYGALKLGSGWGRYANATGNPNGPVKGPILKMLEAALPAGEKLVYEGTPEYAALQARRAADYLADRKARSGDLPWTDPEAKARVEALAAGVKS